VTDGILNLDKPPAISSARAVALVKRLLPRGVKIGHAGTLDPFATGVLLLLIGRATKKCEALMDQRKQYDAIVKFGATTATDDPESSQIPWPDQSVDSTSLRPESIDEVLSKFTGPILQTPPVFSALKINGRRAYKLARSGKTPAIMPRPVMIYSIVRTHYVWPLLKLRVDCGRGTYIRALARDIGAALNVGGHLSELRRTRIGPFHVESAAKLESLTENNLAERIVPLGEVEKE
jgi:tRNA pseudouridine55 synthase